MVKELDAYEQTFDYIIRTETESEIAARLRLATILGVIDPLLELQSPEDSTGLQQLLHGTTAEVALRPRVEMESEATRWKPRLGFAVLTKRLTLSLHSLPVAQLANVIHKGLEAAHQENAESEVVSVSELRKMAEFILAERANEVTDPLRPSFEQLSRKFHECIAVASVALGEKVAFPVMYSASDRALVAVQTLGIGGTEFGGYFANQSLEQFKVLKLNWNAFFNSLPAYSQKYTQEHPVFPERTAEDTFLRYLFALRLPNAFKPDVPNSVDSDNPAGLRRSKKSPILQLHEQVKGLYMLMLDKNKLRIPLGEMNKDRARLYLFACVMETLQLSAHIPFNSVGAENNSVISELLSHSGYWYLRNDAQQESVSLVEKKQLITERYSLPYWMQSELQEILEIIEPAASEIEALELLFPAWLESFSKANPYSIDQLLEELGPVMSDFQKRSKLSSSELAVFMQSANPEQKIVKATAITERDDGYARLSWEGKVNLHLPASVQFPVEQIASVKTVDLLEVIPLDELNTPPRKGLLHRLLAYIRGNDSLDQIVARGESVITPTEGEVILNNLRAQFPGVRVSIAPPDQTK